MPRIIALALCLCLALTGCASNVRWPWQPAPQPAVGPAPEEPPTYEGPAVPMQGLALSPNSRFDDVPQPVGLEEQRDRSYVLEQPGLRVGRMVYKSRDTLTELAQFYLREAPLTDWEKESVNQSEDQITIEFSKRDELMTILVINNPGVPLVSKPREVIIHLRPRPAS